MAGLHHTFTGGWALAEQAAEGTENHAPATRVAKKVAKLVANDLPQVAPVLNGAVKEIIGDDADVQLDPDEVEAALKGDVKTAVKEVVSIMVEEAVEEDGGRPR